MSDKTAVTLDFAFVNFTVGNRTVIVRAKPLTEPGTCTSPAMLSPWRVADDDVLTDDELKALCLALEKLGWGVAKAEWERCADEVTVQ